MFIAFLNMFVGIENYCNLAGRRIALLLVANHPWSLVRILRFMPGMSQSKRCPWLEWSFVVSILGPMSRKRLQAFVSKNRFIGLGGVWPMVQDVWTHTHRFIPTHLHTYLPACLPTYLPRYIHTYILTYIHTCITVDTCIHTNVHT